MDWDTVSHRLEEFDARVENPNSDNPRRLRVDERAAEIIRCDGGAQSNQR